VIIKLIKAAIIAAVLVAIVQSLPDLKRYLELRDM
jgi:glutaredoxin-related protein